MDAVCAWLSSEKKKNDTEEEILNERFPYSSQHLAPLTQTNMVDRRTRKLYNQLEADIPKGHL